MPRQRRKNRHAADLDLRTIASTWLLMGLGALLGAVQVVVFMIPADVVPGGVSSLAMITNALTGAPVGMTVLLVNLPILYLGYRMLGGWVVLAQTVLVVVVFSLLVDGLTWLEIEPVSDDRLLNTLFGGALGGVSSGLVYRAGATYGGTSTIARIVQNRTGTPMSTTFLYTDAGLIALAGVVYGWESALYAVIALVLGGLAADYVMEGPSVVRLALIVTDRPRSVSEAVITRLNRSLSGWPVQGMFTGQPHNILFVTIPRSEASLLHRIVLEADPHAFVVIGLGHTAYGANFRHIRHRSMVGELKPSEIESLLAVADPLPPYPSAAFEQFGSAPEPGTDSAGDSRGDAGR